MVSCQRKLFLTSVFCSYYSKVTLFFYLCSKKTSCQNFSKKYSATGKKKQSAFLIQCTILFDKRDIASRKATAELVRERQENLGPNQTSATVSAAQQMKISSKHEHLAFLCTSCKHSFHTEKVLSQHSRGCKSKTSCSVCSTTKGPSPVLELLFSPIKNKKEYTIHVGTVSWQGIQIKCIVYLQTSCLVEEKLVFTTNRQTV